MKIIEVKHLKKAYGEIKAIQDISFDVDEGSMFAFLGVNGAGKSTTINILCSITKKDEGQVTVGGFDLDKQKEEIRKLIGVVFQNSVLDGKLSVYENLLTRASYYGLFNEQFKQRLTELSELLDLGGILKQKYSNLSGGQRRRVDIARALLNRPKVLFLDEPTTGLDPQTRIMVWNVINDLRKKANLTVFLTTHYMEETVNADKVVVIDAGEIVAMDTPHRLKKKYTKDCIKLYLPKDKEIEKNFEGMEFEYKMDAYYITVKNSEEAKYFVIDNRDIIDDFEIIKGDMDDVFLAVTGKRLEK